MLTPDEIAFYRDERPWGFILFARNVGEPEQLSDLVASMRESVGRPDAPVFIDQEGGRVQRLRPPMAADYPTASELGKVHARDPQAGVRAAWLMSRLHAMDLNRYGITADCLPVLDVPIAGAHDVIGDRAYAHDPQTVVALGRAASEGLMAGGVLPVMKHVPGHGRAFSDSHKALPQVRASVEELRAHDFVSFKALADLPMAMTAHIVFQAIDPARPATTSEKVIQEIIRGEIGFDGLLMSDDVSMHALSGDFSERAEAILAAGCDLVLHCHGIMPEMRAVAEKAPELSGKSLERANRALACLQPGDDTEELAARAEFEAYFAAVA
ncbi:beta-N-acetylhexosaminidase [uncultured Nitratireductor sp.]|uniref:beta-N-acetylhexosaminidase n=1 Tax=uncultured Nitratireductor sp. TaxID=520953 RepID=UPI0025D6444E|nr:beta-N-acetylhexosaminidase [uncultured Nitratireductor sp.]